MHVIGGSNDGAGDAQNGFICRGGRMLNEETYENFWDLYIQDVTTMGFKNDDRMLLGKLMITPEDKLDDMTIQDWFRSSPHFFETNFWYMWQTTFAEIQNLSLVIQKRPIGKVSL